MSLAPSPSAVANSIETELLAGNVLVTRMVGHASRELAEVRFAQFRTRLGFLQAPRWVLDQSTMTGFDPRAVAAGGRWFQLFREHQGNDVVIVSNLPGARMVAASLAFSVRINISTCSTLAEALARFGVAPAPERHSTAAG